jgi:RNA polymerase sigma-70 factor (ECF subfamily)
VSVHAEPEDDVALLTRTGSGDREAFDRLVDRHQAAVFRFIRTLGPDPASSEDILQETFLAAWRGAGTFRAQSSVRTWLFTIARNTAARQYRRRAGEPVRRDLATLDDLGAAAGWGADPDPEAMAMRQEERAAVARALEALDPEDRRVLVLRDLEELTGEEAADVLEVTLAALKSRLHRARLRFAAHLRRETSHGL